MQAKKSVVVEQHVNPTFSDDEPANKTNNPRYFYRVVSTVNTIKVSIGEKLTPWNIDELISEGVQVTIKAPK